jgi:acyl-CoA synthetase (AMP-forming)/AMP-acid ligase II
MASTLGLIRSQKLTLANLLDELLPLRAGCLTSLGFDQEAGDPRTFYGLWQDVAVKSRFLIEETGLERGDRVAIFRTNDVQCFHWFLAILRAGGIAVPLNPLLTLAEAQNICSRCAVSVAITDRTVFDGTIGSKNLLPVRCLAQSGQGPDIEGSPRFTAQHLDAAPLAPAPIAPSDPAVIFHTSGTSGLPKPSVISSRTLLAGRAMPLLAAHLVRGRARALFSLPWAHVMAVSTALQGLMLGAPAFFLSRFDTAAAISAIERHRLNVVVGVPAMFIRLLAASPSRESLASVRLWVSASDHLPEAHRRQLLEYGGAFLNVYGMVELGGAAMFGIDWRRLPLDGELCLPLPPYHIRVVTQEGRSIRTGEVGECQIRGPGVTGRCWGDEAGVPMAPGGWLRTGDLATRNRLGLVRLAGRAKDVIKSGGYTIFPNEVEEVLAAHPDVLRAAVFGVPHPDKGEQPVAVVESLKSSEDVEEALEAYCRGRLAPYKVPRRFYLMAAGTLPQGVTEKVLKRVLQAQHAADFTGAN